MLITGKKRPFCFVLKQEKPLNRGEKGVFHNGTVAAGCHPRHHLVIPAWRGSPVPWCRSDEAISKKKRGVELSLRTPNRGEAISKRRGGGSLPLASAPCHPREGGDLPVAYAIPSPKGTPLKNPGSLIKNNARESPAQSVN